jgi:drug/metabolite transporter (DMT)-like permease
MIVLLASFACLLWGSAYPAIKNGYYFFAISPSDIPSKMVFAGYRFLFAGLILIAVAYFLHRPYRPSGRRELAQLSLLGLTQTSIQYIFFYVGLAYTTGVKGSIMNATGTFFSVLLAHFIYRNEKLSFPRIAGCVAGFAGVMVVNFEKSLLDFNFTFLGEGCVVIAAFILAASSIYGKRISQQMDSMFMTAYQLAIGGAILLLAGYAGGGTLSGFTLKSTLLLGYLAVLSSAAFALWSALLKYNKVGTVTVFNFLIPVFGTVLSAIFLGERFLEIRNGIALILVCAGIWFVTKEDETITGKPKSSL